LNPSHKPGREHPINFLPKIRKVKMNMPSAGEAQEVAEAIVWLLGDTASYTTGALLDVGGGR
jgi:NAD(P)-dependent dehydrogenase (short-subunit alcohol dehydrogenase family)